MELHSRLRMLRERTGMNQQEFCNSASKKGIFITVREYRAMEKGKCRVTLSLVQRVVMALGISADAWLLFDDSKLPPPVMGGSERRKFRGRGH